MYCIALQTTFVYFFFPSFAYFPLSISLLPTHFFPNFALLSLTIIAMTPFVFSEIQGRTAYLRGDEAKHCQKVMRKRKGEDVIGIDGKGWMYRAMIVGQGKGEVELEILDREEHWGEKKQQIQLLVSPLHKPDRFEWLVEKAVELGVNSIVPYVGKHTVKTGVRIDRLERIAMAALKQSMRSRLPEIGLPVAFEDALEEVNGDIRLVGHGPSGLPMAAQMGRLGTAGSCTILVGPEGDFAEEELEMALAAGFEPVQLGENRLRSETAAVHLLGLVKFAMGY